MGSKSLRPRVTILFAFVLNAVIFFSLQMNEHHRFTVCPWMSECLSPSTFCFNDSMHLSCMDSTSLCKTCWLMLSQHDLTVFHKASCGITECLAFSVFSAPKMLNGVEVRWLWGTSMIVHSRVQAFKTLWYRSLSCLSPNIHPPVTVTKSITSVNWTFFIIDCETLVFFSPPQLFVFVSLLRLCKTAFFWQDDHWLDSCIVYLVKSVSVIK